MNNKSSLKTLYLTLLTIVTIICIVLGTCVHVFRLFSFSFKKSNVMQKELEFDFFDSIDLDVDAGDLSIVYGDAYRVNFFYPEEYAPEVSVTDGTLSITQSLNKIKLWDFDSSNYEITIEIPADTELSDLKADMNMGNFELADLKLKSLFIDADMGNIELENMQFDTATIQANMGNVEFTDCTFDSADCNANMGNVEVLGIFSSLAVECDLGAVTVDSEKIDDASLSLTTSLGSVEVNGESKGSSYHQK